MRSFVCVFGCLGLLACGASDPADEGPTLEADIQPIFDANCAVPACHGGRLVQAELSLAADRARASLVGVPSTQVAGATRVAPGDPEASLLWQVLNGPMESELPGEPPLVERMPRDQAPLSLQELQLVEAWIEAGAN